MTKGVKGSRTRFLRVMALQESTQMRGLVSQLELEAVPNSCLSIEPRGKMVTSVTAPGFDVCKDSLSAGWQGKVVSLLLNTASWSSMSRNTYLRSRISI